jgi:hypothetical protein
MSDELLSDELLRAASNAMSCLIHKRLQRWGRGGGTAAATGTHACGRAHAATTRGTAHGQQQDAQGGARRTQACQLSTAGRHGRGPQAEGQTRSGGGPGKGFLAETRRGQGRRIGGELEMPEDLPDDLALCDGGDDA